MPFVEEGAKYPREVEAPFGLPPGWSAIERAYGPNAKTAGQTYIRFANGKHKQVGSIRQATIKDAEDRGIDPQQAVQEHETAVEKDKDAKKKAREEAGFLEGDELDKSVEAFRAKFGQLSGATVCCIPGWKGESKVLENCGQNAAMYYSPTGWRYPLLKNIEAHFGLRILSGLEIPDIEAARLSVKLDENGKPIHAARHENVQEIFSHQEEGGVRKKRRRSEQVRRVAKEDYEPQSSFLVQLIDLQKDTHQNARTVHENLLQRKFDKDVEMISVDDSHSGITSSRIVRGLYYQRPGLYNGRSHYQQVKIVVSPHDSNQMSLVCSSLYVHWDNGRWIIGVLVPGKAGFAICEADDSKPYLAKPWLLLKDEPKAADSAKASNDVLATTDKSAKDDTAHEIDSLAQKAASKVDPDVKASQAKRTKSATAEASESGADKNHPEDASFPSAVSPANDPINRDLLGKGDDAIHTEKVYFWEDVRCQREQIEPSPSPQEVPSHWPAGVRIDPGKWQPWLLKDWGQGVKTQPRGDDVKVYVSPSGTLCYSKAAVEKKVGELFEAPAPGVEWPSWLPKNWAISKRQKNNGDFAKIHIAPEGDRYFATRAEVEKFLGGKMGKQRMGSDGRLIGRLCFAPDVEMRLKALASD